MKTSVKAKRRLRIAVGQINHESNPFAAAQTTLAEFQQCAWYCDDAIFTAYAGVNDYIAGMIDQGRAMGVEVLPSLSTTAGPSGLITDECYAALKTTLLDRMAQYPDLDGICLALHGAGQSVSCQDIEGDLLEALQRRFGLGIPIFVSLDTHAHLTPAMRANCMGFVGVKHYPHTDYAETGAKAMELLVRTVSGAIRPVMSVQRIPCLVSPAGAATFESPAKEIREFAQQLVRQQCLLDCTFFHGFPFGDTPDTAAYAVAIADGNLTRAEEATTRLKNFVWERREQFSATFPEPVEGIAQALRQPGRPVVINETSDNPGSGAPGDGTFLLRALLEADEPGTCFGFIYDPEVADQAHRAGIGARIDIRLGGKTDRLHGDPIELRGVRVAALSDGQFTIVSPMMTGVTLQLGPTARLVAGNVEIIVACTRVQTFDDQLFRIVGVDIMKCRLVALKSIQHFKAFFAPRAAAIVTVDPPGLSTGRFERLNFQHIQRPLFPLDTHG